MPGFDNNTVYADNYDFRGVQPVLPQVSVAGQLPVGTGASPAILVGAITSPLGTLTVGYSSPNITLDLVGGSTAIDSVVVDTTTGAGTNPVLPTIGGQITMTGGQYPAGTFGTRVITINSSAANTIQVDAQISSAVVATNSTKNGLSHFDSARFTVDANGFVTLNASGAGETITGDSGGALNPSAGNWNILGRSGSKTSGTGSTLTIKSPPYADQGGSTTVTLNSGSFATAAITLTTPVTAGLADGDLLEFVATNGVLVVQLAATQVGHLGSVATSVAGTFTSTATGDALCLRYQASTNDFWATSSIGVWTLA